MDAISDQLQDQNKKKLLYMNEIIEVSMQEEGEAEIEESDAQQSMHNANTYHHIFEIDKNNQNCAETNHSFGFQEDDESI